VEHWPNWTPTELEVKPLGNTELRVGAQYRVTQPKQRPAVYEVTECTANKAFPWVQKRPGSTMIADHRLVPRNGTTEVELSFASKGRQAKRSESCGPLSEETNGADRLCDHCEIQKPHRAAGLQEELPHIRIVSKFSDLGSQKEIATDREIPFKM